MRELSSIDIRFLVAELRQSIGGRIDRLYAPTPEELLFQIRKAGESKLFIRAAVPQVIYIASGKDGMPERPSGWCNGLRNLIEGAKIVDVLQPHSERVVQFVLEKRETQHNLYLELFGKGNIIITDIDGMIVMLQHELVLKSHAVERGKKYALPPGTDTFNLGKEEFIKLITESGKNVSSALSTVIGVGSFYAKELCERTGVDPKSESGNAHLDELYDRFIEMLQAPADPQIASGISLPFTCETVSGQFETTPSFSVAIEKMYASSQVGDFEASATKAVDQQRERLMHNIAAQETAIAKLEKEQVVCQRIGETLYERYQEFESMLNEFSAARKKGTIDAAMKKHLQVKEYKQASGDVVVEIIEPKS
jgi:predicted ribosome quality control (RQC) complex YloA/Tae2 family protein